MGESDGNPFVLVETCHNRPSRVSSMSCVQMFFVGNNLKAPSDDSTGGRATAPDGIGTVGGVVFGASELEQPTDSKATKTSACFIYAHQVGLQNPQSPSVQLPLCLNIHNCEDIQ